MNIIWLTQGGFLFESGHQRLLVDPYMGDSLEPRGMKRMAPFPLATAELRPNVFLSTHDHLDHLDPDAVAAVAPAYPDCVFAGSERSYRHFGELGIPESRRKLLLIGQAQRLGGFEILPVFAQHSDPTAIGVVISADGKRVYLSGDTEFDPAIIANPQLHGLDLILICINGKLGNMTLEQALEVVKTLRPKAAYPMHYGLFAVNTAEPQPFVDGCRANGIKSLTMTAGQINPL